MTIEETIDKLIQLRLPHMASALRSALERAAGGALSIEDCMGLMVDREWTERENRRTGRRIKDAKLGMQACIEDLWCDPARGLDKSVVSFADRQRSAGAVRDLYCTTWAAGERPRRLRATQGIAALFQVDKSFANRS